MTLHLFEQIVLTIALVGLFCSAIPAVGAPGWTGGLCTFLAVTMIVLLTHCLGF